MKGERARDRNKEIDRKRVRRKHRERDSQTYSEIEKKKGRERRSSNF